MKLCHASHCIIIIRCLRCLACPIRPSNGSFLCFEYLVTIGSLFLQRFNLKAVFGGISTVWSMTRLATFGQAFSHNRAAADPSITPYVRSVSSFLCTCLLPSRRLSLRFLSDAPGKHRRARPGFHRICYGCDPDLFRYLVLKSYRSLSGYLFR